MKKLIQHRHLLRQNMVAIIALSLSLYFAYHLVMGPRGYLELKQLEYRISQISNETEMISEERYALEKRVVMMRPGSICPDLLEERVRYTLGYTSKEEYMLLHDRS